MTISDSDAAEKAEVFRDLGGQEKLKKIHFFDLHDTAEVLVEDAEKYCEYPETIRNSDIDLHEYHKETCWMQILVSDAENDGLSLGAYRFPPHFSFPRHWHDSDQIIYVLEGLLIQGNRVMHPGEGYFTRAGVPYTFTAGPAGVKFLEFRPKTEFRTVMVDEDPERFRKAYIDGKPDSTADA